MKKQVMAVLAFLGCFGFGQRANAQTVYGPGGLFVHPTAFTRPKGDIGLNVSFLPQRLSGNVTSEWMPVSLTAGVSPSAEVGILYVRRRMGAGFGDSGGLFGKYQFFSDTPARPALAIAGSVLGGDVRQSSLSVVASHRFLRGERELLTLHAGLQGALRADIRPELADASAYFALELPVARNLRLAGEIGSRFRFDRSSTSSIGLMWSPAPSLHIGVAYVNTGRAVENGFFVGVGYQLGGRK